MVEDHTLTVVQHGLYQRYWLEAPDPVLDLVLGNVADVDWVADGVDRLRRPRSVSTPEAGTLSRAELDLILERVGPTISVRRFRHHATGRRVDLDALAASTP